MNPLERILERETIQKALVSNENDIFEGRMTNRDFKWLIEQAEKVEKLRMVSNAESLGIADFAREALKIIEDREFQARTKRS